MNVCRQQCLGSLIRLSINARLPTLVRCKSDVLEDSQKVTTNFENPEWVAKFEKRHRWMFEWLDGNKDSEITLKEILVKANDEICQGLGATKEQTKAHNTAVRNFFEGIGIVDDVEIPWDQFIQGWQNHANLEVEKWNNGDSTLIREWGAVVLDIIDTDRNGSISVDEWITYTSIAFAPMMEGWTDADAEATFDICDVDEDGKLGVDEMTKRHVGFWYTLDEDCDGMYGDAVP